MSKPTPAEWEVLAVLWQEAPLSAREIYDKKKSDGSPQTIRTLLERLEKKGAVKREVIHRMTVFYPVWEREKLLHEESKGFFSRFFGGNSSAGVAAFLAEEPLNIAEIERLQQILDAKRREAES